MVGLSVWRPRSAAFGLAALLAPLWACDPEGPCDTGATVCGRLMEGDLASGGEGVSGWVVFEEYNTWDACYDTGGPWPHLDSGDWDPTNDGPPDVYEASHADENGWFTARFPFAGHYPYYSARYGTYGIGSDLSIPADHLEGTHCIWKAADSGTTRLVLWLDP